MDRVTSKKRPNRVDGICLPQSLAFTVIVTAAWASCAGTVNATTTMTMRIPTGGFTMSTA